MPIHHLLYVSKAAYGLTTDDLDDMVDPFRKKNHSRGVTGVLFYSAGHFIQLLEGAHPTIERLYETICLDTRHHEVEKLLFTPATRRVFNHWDMGLLNIEYRDELNRDRLKELLCQGRRLGPQNAPLPLSLLAEFCMMLPRSHNEFVSGAPPGRARDLSHKP